MPPKISWTDKMVADLVRWRDAEGFSFREIGDRLGLAESTVYARYNTHKRSLESGRDITLDRLRSEIPPDDRDLTARVFGDPPSQRSALYRRQHGGET